MMLDKETLQTLLNLPDIAIDRVVIDEHKTLKIHIHGAYSWRPEEGAHCHQCHQGNRIKAR